MRALVRAKLAVDVTGGPAAGVTVNPTWPPSPPANPHALARMFSCSRSVKWNALSNRNPHDPPVWLNFWQRTSNRRALMSPAWMPTAAPEQAEPSIVPPPTNPPPVVVPSEMAPVLTHRNRSPDPCALMIVFRSPDPMMYWPGPSAFSAALPQLMLNVPGSSHGVRPALSAFDRNDVSLAALPVGAMTAMPPPELLSRTKNPPSELMSSVVIDALEPVNSFSPTVASWVYGPASVREFRNDSTPDAESTAWMPIDPGP